MEKIAQPLTADERHHANAAIELASTLLQHARWGVAGFTMIFGYAILQLVVFRASRRVFINPLGLIATIGVIAFIASSPLANAAESIRFRSRRPLFIAIVLVGLCVGITLLAALAAVVVDASALIRHDTDAAIGDSIVAVIALVVLGCIAWVFRVFVVALRAIDRLKAKPPQGFAVVLPSGDKPVVEPPPFKLPPRPKL